MKKIQYILIILITFILSTLLIIVFEHEKMYAKESPKELYQVYLDGEKIGLIKSKAKLEQYIDQEQQEVKEKYKVKTVYPPKNLYIQKYIGYEDKVLSEKEVYDIIKEKGYFTVKGYVITIKKDKDKPIKINVLDKNLFKRAADATIEAFVTAADYKAYKEDNQPKIETTGRIIENLMLEPWPTYKETYIPVDEYIFTDEKKLTRYLLFGTLEEQKKYIVQEGNTIENIAFDNKLGVEEFLVVNPQFNKKNILLTPGQEVEVGLIRPVFNVIVEEHLVENMEVKYQTKVVYDNTIPYGTSYVKQKGVNGLNRVVQKIKSVSGNRTEGYITSYELLRPMVEEIVVKGIKNFYGQIVIDPDSNWGWPTNPLYIITSRYGWRRGGFHDGIDICESGYGSPIYAANDGIVYRAKYGTTSIGYHVILKHDNEYYTVYGHLSKIKVKEGDRVSKGDIIGEMGSTGRSSGPHLHFAVYIGVPYASGSRHFNPLLLYK